MGNENTAIHDLLAGVSRKAIADDPDDDILFAGSRKPEAPRPPVAAGAAMFTLPPPPPPAAFGAAIGKPATSPFANLPTQPAVVPLDAGPPARMASGTQPPPVINTAPGVPTLALSIVQQHQQQLVPMPAIDGAHATVRVSKSSAWRIVGAPRNPKLYAIPVGLFVVVVVLLGVYLSGGSKNAAAQVAAAPAASKAEPIVEPIAEPAAEPIAEAAPAPAAAPVVEPAPPVAQQDVIVPPTVVEASRFAAKAEPTVATVNVTATPIETAAAPEPTVAAIVEDPAPVTKPVKSAKKSKRELARDRRAAKRAGKRGKAKPRVAVAAPAKKSAKAESLNGNGALAITSSAPREVWVDGRNSKRMTPLRVLLKPGKHTVTLFDKANGKAKSFDVEIKANTTTKVSK